jgi:hypothetical protein
MYNRLSYYAKASIRFMFLCDAIHQGDDRQLDVSGLVSDLLFTDLTEQMQPVDLDALLVVGIHTEDRFRQYGLTVRVEEAGRPEEPLLHSPIGLVGGEFLPMKCQRIDIKVHGPGTFWFNAYLDDVLAARYPLSVEYAQMSPS